MSSKSSATPSNIRNVTQELKNEQDKLTPKFRSDDNTAKSSISNLRQSTEDKNISKLSPCIHDHKRVKLANSGSDEMEQSNYDERISTPDVLSSAFLANAPLNPPYIAPKHTSVLQNYPHTNTNTNTSPSPVILITSNRHERNERCVLQKARVTLAMPEDVESLNSLHCFVRSKLLEIFVDGFESNHRVGIRCIHCSHIRHCDRDAGSIQYPHSLADIHRSVCTWQNIHFKNCRYVPSDVLSHYMHLKNDDRIKSDDKYWFESARKMGLVDDTIISSSGVTCTEVSQRHGMNTKVLDHERENSNLENGIRFLDISCMGKHIKKKVYERDRSSLSTAALSLRPRASRNIGLYQKKLPRFEL